MLYHYKLAWRAKHDSGWMDWQVVYVPCYPVWQEMNHAIQDSIKQLRTWIEFEGFEDGIAIRRARLEEEPRIHILDGGMT